MSSTIKFLTLNFFQGKCLDEVISYLNEESFDLIHLQEVSGDSLSFPKIDCFAEIQRRTGLEGELLVSWQMRGNKKAYMGNATFYKPKLICKERRELFSIPFREIEDPKNSSPETHPRSSLFLRFEFQGKTFWSVNTHMAWGPTPFDEPYKIEIATSLAEALKSLQDPFILAGDFNVTSQTKVVAIIESLARNLSREAGLPNTLNPQLHRASHLFPPGLAVDYIFPSFPMKTEDFALVDQPQLSDHYGLRVTLF